jgi:hypothetical protein
MAAKLTDEQKISYLHTLWDSELNYRMNLYSIDQYEAIGIPNLTANQLADYNFRLTVEARDIANMKKYIKTLKTGGVPNLKKADIILPRLVELQSLQDQRIARIAGMDADWAQYLIDHERERVDIELWITQSNPPQEEIDARWATWNENYTSSFNDYTNTKAAIQLEIDILEDLKTSVSTWKDLL